MSCVHLEIRNLTVDLLGSKPRRLVNSLDLTVPAGKVVALVGESGAGKSMTSLAVMDLLPRGIVRTGGEIVVNHQPVSGLDSEGKRRIRNRQVSMIMQNPMSAFDPIFKVGVHFHETLAAHGQGGGWWDKAEQALREVGFDDAGGILDIYPFQMSGGMLQRVMIALALITDPQFLIADEATTDLDMVSQSRILSILKERQRCRHLGMLLITHDLSVAAYLADEVAVMRHGALVETGAVADIFFRPRHPYTRKLLDVHNNLYKNGFERMRFLPGRLSEAETA